MRIDTIKLWVELHDLREDLPAELTGLFKPTDSIYWTVPGRVEPLAYNVRVVTDHRMELSQSAFFGAREVGFVTENTADSQRAFAGRSLLAILSEPHSSHEFVYDMETGTRILPRGDVSRITNSAGDKTAGLNRMADIMEAPTKEARAQKLAELFQSLRSNPND